KKERIEFLKRTKIKIPSHVASLGPPIIDNINNDHAKIINMELSKLPAKMSLEDLKKFVTKEGTEDLGTWANKPEGQEFLKELKDAIETDKIDPKRVVELKYKTEYISMVAGKNEFT